MKFDIIEIYQCFISDINNNKPISLGFYFDVEKLRKEYNSANHYYSTEYAIRLHHGNNNFSYHILSSEINPK